MSEHSGANDREDWRPVDVPASVSLHDVTNAVAGPVAVGNTGTVLGRSADGSWDLLVSDGPSARGEALHATASTDDGERIWFAGANGALGSYDVDEARRRDHSEPDGITDALPNLAVAGNRGSEKLLVADDNGAVYTADVDGRTLDWGREYRPAGDSELTDLAASPGGVGHAVDTDGTVWQTTADDGWAAIGVEAAENSFYAVAASGDAVLAGGGNGRLYRSGDGGDSWTPHSLGSFTIEAVDATSERALGAGTDGAIVTRADDWNADGWDGSKTVNGAVLGRVDVAVCDDGVVLERAVAAAAADTGDSSE